MEVEDVLWTTIADIQHTAPDIINVVYTGDVDVTKEQIIFKVKVGLLANPRGENKQIFRQFKFDIGLSPKSLHSCIPECKVSR